MVAIDHFSRFIKSKRLDAHLINVWERRYHQVHFQVIKSGFPVDVDDRHGDANATPEIKAEALALPGEIAQAILDRVSLAPLEARAHLLYNSCVPETLQTYIQRDIPKGSLLQISSNEQWIPWELLHDGSAFLGDTYRIIRLPRPTLSKPNRPNFNDARVEHDDGTHVWPPKEVLNVVGRDFEAPDEGAFAKTFTRFESRSLTITQCLKMSRTHLQLLLEHVNLLHITCHGSVSPPMLLVSDGSPSHQDLWLSHVKGFPVPTGLIVFANSCYSGQAGGFLDSLSSFGFEFVMKGAFAYIGTIGLVDIRSARLFANTFYCHVFRKGGAATSSVLNSFYKAKSSRAARRSRACLLYGLYANPLHIVN